MIKLGKTYGNIMVDLQQTNKKLVERSKNIIMKICNLDYNKASELLLQSNGNVKVCNCNGKKQAQTSNQL